MKPQTAIPLLNRRITGCHVPKWADHAFLEIEAKLAGNEFLFEPAPELTATAEAS